MVIGLVWAAARERSPLSPTVLGGFIAVLGFISASRIFYRIIQPPFGSGNVEIGVAAYLALLTAVLIVVSGIVHLETVRKASYACQSPRR